MSKTLIALVLLWALPSVQAETQSQSAILAFNKGVQKLNAGKYAEALPFFDEAISRDERFAEAYYARGVCKRNRENLTGALSDLNRALQINPEYYDACATRGAVLYEQERWTSAYADFDFVLKARPQDPSALLGRGLVSLRMDEYKRAQRDLSLFVKLQPNDPLVPQIRKFLASMKGEPAPPDEEPSTYSESPQRAASAPSAASRRAARELFMQSNPMADTYREKVMRGEKAQAEGDIYSHPNVPAASAGERR